MARDCQSSFPHVFAPYALSPSFSGLTFLSTAVGLVLCGALTPLMLYDYRRMVKRADNEARSVEPEVRLRVAMLGTWAVPLGLFWRCVIRDDQSLACVSNFIELIRLARVTQRLGLLPPCLALCHARRTSPRRHRLLVLLLLDVPLPHRCAEICALTALDMTDH